LPHTGDFAGPAAPENALAANLLNPDGTTTLLLLLMQIAGLAL
jgi:hypothetical protein